MNKPKVSLYYHPIVQSMAIITDREVKGTFEDSYESFRIMLSNDSHKCFYLMDAKPGDIVFLSNREIK